MSKYFVIYIFSCYICSLVASGYTTSPSKQLASSKRLVKNIDEILHVSFPKTKKESLVSLRAGAENASDKLESHKNLRKELVAEFIGTFIIVQLGTGSVMCDIFYGAFSGLFQVAATWAFAVTLAISTTAAVSGAHLNPSITFSLALFRGFQWRKVIPYSLAQTLGAIAASALNLVLFGAKIKSFEQANGIVRGTSASILSARAFGEYISDAIPCSTAFLAEAFGTAVLSFVVFSLTNPKNKATQPNGFLVPPLIGVTVGALISVLAPLTQAGLNPARDFGPRIVAGIAGWKGVAFTKWWLYVLAPLIGAPIGAAVSERFLYGDD